MTPDYLGADGGKLAAAFAAGCAAAYVFLLSIVNSPLRRRIKELESSIANERTRLEAEIADERKRCDAMETRLVSRIQQLETLLLTHTSGPLRQAIQKVVSEQRTTEDDR